MQGFGYGQNYFGLNVDYAEHILNTDDPVPTTNDPLQHCVVYDVTHCKERESFILPEVSLLEHFYLILKPCFSVSNI